MSQKKLFPPLEELTVETASEHICRRVPVVGPTAHIDEVRGLLVSRAFDSATHIAVCEDGKLCGIVTIETVLHAAGDTTIVSLMDVDPPAITMGTDQEKAVWHAVEHNESALAVVDSTGHFEGFIPPQRLLAILLWEHEEDMTRLGGYMRDTSAARTASLEAVAHRFWHRIPWLLIGLLGALAAADIVGFFERQLQETVTLAFFIPGIVYLADAVGTQTETLIVRGLSVGINIHQIVTREALTGILIGMVLSVVFFPLALARWGDSAVALVVSLALMAACSTATLIALALPSIFHYFGVDPAYGTGPLATVLQDLISIVVYFTIATAIIQP